ncbi:hypothetical protein [Bifidobacterium xylocopae]|uniref:Uncharacterized protein n=1 Tax=Bifidobacterium xylocopae TaxID=2493119 RepID=A0A366KB37_9BIFI|nr:hypothetical protein [Bifidobacterium xylocopae]RBP98809.1 hypothetical protein CRD59_07085 [Bifidobacterium xylocopae]
MKPEEAADDEEVLRQVGAPLKSLATAAMLKAQGSAASSQASSATDADRSRRESEEIATRKAALQATSRADLETVFSPDWIDRADAHEIYTKLQEAAAWRSEDTRCAQAYARIEESVSDRYGVRPSTYQDEIALAAGLENGHEKRGRANDMRADAAALDDENKALLDQADLQDQLANSAIDQEDKRQLEEDRDQALQEAAIAGQDEEQLDAEAERLHNAGLEDEQVQGAMRVEVTHTKDVNRAVKAGENQKRGHTRRRSRNRAKSRASAKTMSRGR